VNEKDENVECIPEELERIFNAVEIAQCLWSNCREGLSDVDAEYADKVEQGLEETLKCLLVLVASNPGEKA